MLRASAVHGFAVILKGAEVFLVQICWTGRQGSQVSASKRHCLLIFGEISGDKAFVGMRLADPLNDGKRYTGVTLKTGAHVMAHDFHLSSSNPARCHQPWPSTVTSHLAPLYVPSQPKQADEAHEQACQQWLCK